MIQGDDRSIGMHILCCVQFVGMILAGIKMMSYSEKDRQKYVEDLKVDQPKTFWGRQWQLFFLSDAEDKSSIWRQRLGGFICTVLGLLLLIFVH